MKKILLVLTLFLGTVACDKDEHLTIYEDMMYFAEEFSSGGEMIKPVVQMEAERNSQVNIYVMRNLFVANDHPRQNVKIVVDEKQSSAIEGVDFTISESSLNFKNKEAIRVPLTINIHSQAKKTIVLQLAYEYYKECPAEGRKVDRLKIKIK